MNFAKSLVRRVLSKFGFQITRIESNLVRFEAFNNLASAYQELTSEEILPDNKLRKILLARVQGTPPTEAYSIIRSLHASKNLDGVVCEFGVAEGETSALIANEILETNKTFHLFDSFQGLSVPCEKDKLIDDVLGLGNMAEYAGKMSFPESALRYRLGAISFPKDRTIIHKGFIDEVLRNDESLPTSVCFAYVDFDFYEPILATLEFLDSVLTVGGVIVVDDYGFFSSGSKTAVDEWLAKVNSNSSRYQVIVAKSYEGKFITIRKTSNAQ